MKKYLLKKKIDSKGFNLFSSVVAAILLMSGVVLVNTLISTEEKTSNQVYFMVNSFRLNDAAALARSDSLQNFNYYFRESMQDWLTFDSSELNKESFPLINKNNYNDWDEIVDNFERVILLRDNNTSSGFDAAVDSVARKTVEKFKESYYGRYNVTLSDTTSTARENIKFVINKALQGLEPDEKFFQVIDCDESSCEGGAFYFNIPLDTIDDASYEKLPRIIIRDVVTYEEIRIPILPKSRLRIYVPLRLFKAIHYATIRAEEVFDNDRDFEEAKVGFCDDSSCVPRSDPLRGTSGNWTNKCPTDTAEGITQTLDLNPVLSFANSYKVGGGQFGALPLQYFAISKICGNSTPGIDGTTSDDFFNYQGRGGSGTGLLLTEGLVPNCPYQRIDAIASTYVTKTIFGSATPMQCSEILNIYADLTYKETNKNYVIKGNELFYKIRITTGRYNSETDNPSPPQCKNETSPTGCNVS